MEKKFEPYERFKSLIWKEWEYKLSLENPNIKDLLSREYYSNFCSELKNKYQEKMTPTTYKEFDLAITYGLAMLVNNQFGYKSFYNFVSQTNLYKNSNKILDLASGEFAILSLEMANGGKLVTSIDRGLEQNYQNSNIAFVRTELDFQNYNQDLSNYDLVVSRRPCALTEVLIKECQKQNKPFVIELCECEMETLSHSTVKGFLQKMNYLEETYPSVHFCSIDFNCIVVSSEKLMENNIDKNNYYEADEFDENY